MANSYSEYRKSNTPMVPPAQGVYEESTTKKAPLGTRLTFPDGRVYRYSCNGTTALTAGKLCKAGFLNAANWLNKAVAAAVTAGSYSVTLTTTSAATTAADGIFQVNDVDGEGIQYKIKSVAANATTATSTDITLYDPIYTALTTSSEGTILWNPYQLVAVATAATDIIIGVPPIPVSASTSSVSYYFWLQTWGIANVFSDGVPAAGTLVTIGTNATYGLSGTTTNAADTTPVVGIQMLVGVKEEYKPVYLMIAP